MEKERELEKFRNDQNISLGTTPRSRRGKRGGNKGDARRRATARGAIKKNRVVMVDEKKEVRVDNPINCFFVTMV